MRKVVLTPVGNTTYKYCNFIDDLFCTCHAVYEYDRDREAGNEFVEMAGGNVYIYECTCLSGIFPGVSDRDPALMDFQSVIAYLLLFAVIFFIGKNLLGKSTGNKNCGPDCSCDQ